METSQLNTPTSFRNFIRNMHMVPIFQFVSDNKELMIAELLNGSGSCAQGQVIRQAQQLNPMICPRRWAELGRQNVDVKLIFMLNALVKGSTKLQH
jgi:hypothetical protein